MSQPNPPRPDLVYPDGSPEDTAGPEPVHPPAQRAGDGQWLDPDTGMPVGFPLDDPPEGTEWTVQDIRNRRAAWEALGPRLPTEPPPLTEEGRAEENSPAAAVDARVLPQEPANVDEWSEPHFLRNVNGQEVCGTDSDPWPCPTYRRWVDEAARETAAANPPERIPDGATMTPEQAAHALGVDPQELARFLATQNRK